jgi:type IV fimbrial biogenesis protein FimT
MLKSLSAQRRFWHQAGISMIEIMVSIVIVGILAAIGIPSLSTWMLNTQVKATGESLLSALQLARAEAIRQNLRSEIIFNDSNGLASWTVITDSSSVPSTFPVANTIESGGVAEAGKNARIGVSSAALSGQNYATAIAAGTAMNTNPKPGIVFDAFGRVATDASANAQVTRVTRIDVTGLNDVAGSAEANYRRRVVTITDSGLSKLCRPSLPASDPQGCS